MNATCTECGSVFRVDPARVPADGVRARCSVCGGVFAVAAEPAPVSSGAAHASVVDARLPDAAAEEAGVVPPVAPIWGAPEAIPAVRHAVVADSADPVAATAAPTDGSVNAEPSGASAPQTSATSAAGVDAPAAPRMPTPPVPAERVPIAPAPLIAAAPAAPRRPVNPYLANDPGARARRLARALVSDLVAYHPAKREEGLRDGTLKQLFRDEIRKSWDEYVEQIGAPLAEGTTHFQDALNDILGGGRKVF